MAISIKGLKPQDEVAWDEFVSQHPNGTPFHLLAWKRSIQETFQYQPTYLLAMDDTRICGVLPLFLVENFVIGRVLISCPFAVYGGILADSPEASTALQLYVRSFGNELRVDHVELRNAHPEQCSAAPHLSQYVTFTQQTETDELTLLASLPKKTRNIVRKVLRMNYETRIESSDFRRFEDLYSRNMRRLGTPSFPRRHFSSLKTHFGSMVDVREVLLDGKVVAASLNFYFRDHMHVYYAASDPAFKGSAPNNYMYFDHLRWAGQNGYRTFDFGRCKRGTGVFEFKRHWATTMRELPYETVLIRRNDIPNNTPTNPRFRLAIETWKSVPLPITRLLGPQLIRLFP